MGGCVVEGSKVWSYLVISFQTLATMLNCEFGRCIQGPYWWTSLLPVLGTDSIPNYYQTTHIYIHILIRFVLQFALSSYAPCMYSLNYGHKHHVLPMSPQVKCRVATVLRTLGVPRKSVSLLRSLTNMLRCEVGRFLRGPWLTGSNMRQDRPSV